jgi:hypothetical protein
LRRLALVLAALHVGCSEIPPEPLCAEHAECADSERCSAQGACELGERDADAAPDSDRGPFDDAADLGRPPADAGDAPVGGGQPPTGGVAAPVDCPADSTLPVNEILWVVTSTGALVGLDLRGLEREGEPVEVRRIPAVGPLNARFTAAALNATGYRAAVVVEHDGPGPDHAAEIDLVTGQALLGRDGSATFPVTEVSPFEVAQMARLANDEVAFLGSGEPPQIVRAHMAGRHPVPFRGGASFLGSPEGRVIRDIAALSEDRLAVLVERPPESGPSQTQVFITGPGESAELGAPVYERPLGPALAVVPEPGTGALWLAVGALILRAEPQPAGPAPERVMVDAQTVGGIGARPDLKALARSGTAAYAVIDHSGGTQRAVVGVVAGVPWVRPAASRGPGALLAVSHSGGLIFSSAPGAREIEVFGADGVPQATVPVPEGVRGLATRSPLYSGRCDDAEGR